jgi:hypothetical protein
METKVIVAYVVCDDTIKNLKLQDDKQAKMSMAEVMTTAIISAIQYSGNIEKARKSLKSDRYIPNMLSKSQLCRRLNKIEKHVWSAVLNKLSLEFAKHNIENEFVVDSFPIPACKLARMDKNKMYQGKQYLGYCAAKKEYYFGVKLHMVCDVNGRPVQTSLSPASENDVKAFRKINLDLPFNSVIYGDKAYNDYRYEDRLIQEKQIHLMPIRKKNSKRKSDGFLAKIRRKKRKIIETAFSCIEKLMPRSIHAVTRAGFELKIMLFVLAYAFNNVVF